MQRKLITLVLAGAALTAGAAPAGEVADRLGTLADRLGDEYARRVPGADRIPLAVLDFSCGGELARQRAGFAVAELLRIHLARSARFALTERAELERVLHEQSLQLTGAVSQSTAVTLGRLVGVRLLVLGSVERLGGVHQINARIVEVETGSVVAASFEELPVEAFEAEAAPHLKLVPDTQAVGFYLAAGARAGGAYTPAPPVTTAGTFGTLSYASTVETSGELYPLRLKAGARYQPAAWLLIDLGFVLPLETIRITPRWSFAGTVPPGPTTAIRDIDTWSVDLDILWTSRLRRHGRWFAGIGAELLAWAEPAEDSWSSGEMKYPFRQGSNYGEVTYNDLRPSSENGLVRPVLIGGLEWKPQARFGLALAARFRPIPARQDFVYHVTVFDGSPTNQVRREVVGTYTVPPFSIDLTTALYF